MTNWANLSTWLTPLLSLSPLLLAMSCTTTAPQPESAEPPPESRSAVVTAPIITRQYGVNERPLPELPPQHRPDEALVAVALAAESYGDEDYDFGVPPVTTLRFDSYRGPTTTTVPGGKLIRTVELVELMTNGKPQPIIINVAPEPAARLLPGAIWMSGAGISSKRGGDTNDRFKDHLSRLTKGNRQHPIVIYCYDLRCWYAYNAVQRATLAGYKNVYWYRGGLHAWYSADLPYRSTEQDQW